MASGCLKKTGTMLYIQSHTVLIRHRKLKELARSLRIKPVYVLGHLHALWFDALEQQEDGDLTKWTDELIAESSMFDGNAPQYVSLLQLHGWLDNRLIHDWIDYAGPYLRRKYHDSNPKRLAEIWSKYGRVYGRQQEGNNQDTERKQTGNEKEPKRPHILEEIRREEIKKENTEELILFADFEKSAFESWNSLCDRFPMISKIKSISDTRRKKLKLRFAQDSFKNFDQIIKAIESQQFLTGSNDRNWAISFDWLIENDTNHIKVLENRYKDTKNEREVDLNAY